MSEVHLDSKLLAGAAITVLTTLGGGAYNLTKKVEANERALNSDVRWNCVDMELYTKDLKALNPTLILPTFPKQCHH